MEPARGVQTALARVEEIRSSLDGLAPSFVALLAAIEASVAREAPAPVLPAETIPDPLGADLLPGTRRFGIATTGPPLPPGFTNELVSWEGVILNPAAMASFQRASLLLGAPIQVTDSYRTHEQQAAAYANKPGLAAPPGSSYHERGLAIDVDGSAYGGYDSPAFRQVARVLESLGWHRFDPDGEPWHFSYRVIG